MVKAVRINPCGAMAGVQRAAALLPIQNGLIGLNHRPCRALHVLQRRGPTGGHPPQGEGIVDRFAKCARRFQESIVDAVSETSWFPRERWMQDGFEHIIDADGKPTVKTDLVSQ